MVKCHRHVSGKHPQASRRTTSLKLQFERPTSNIQRPTWSRPDIGCHSRWSVSCSVPVPTIALLSLRATAGKPLVPQYQSLVPRHGAGLRSLRLNYKGRALRSALEVRYERRAFPAPLHAHVHRRTISARSSLRWNYKAPPSGSSQTAWAVLVRGRLR
jgi:hypothetical protein